MSYILHNNTFFSSHLKLRQILDILTETFPESSAQTLSKLLGSVSTPSNMYKCYQQHASSCRLSSLQGEAQTQKSIVYHAGNDKELLTGCLIEESVRTKVWFHGIPWWDWNFLDTLQADCKSTWIGNEFCIKTFYANSQQLVVVYYYEFASGCTFTLRFQQCTWNIDLLGKQAACTHDFTCLLLNLHTQVRKTQKFP